MLGQLSNPWWVFIVLGVFAGIISGMLGLGSGTVVIPTLVLVCGFGQKSAQGMALAVMVPMALVAVIRYWSNPQIEMNGLVIGLIVCGAIVGALVGAELAIRLPNHILRKFFAAFLIVVALKMLLTRPRQKSGNDGAGEQTKISLIESGGNSNE